MGFSAGLRCPCQRRGARAPSVALVGLLPRARYPRRQGARGFAPLRHSGRGCRRLFCRLPPCAARGILMGFPLRTRVFPIRIPLECPPLALLIYRLPLCDGGGATRPHTPRSAVRRQRFLSSDILSGRSLAPPTPPPSVFHGVLGSAQKPRFCVLAFARMHKKT